MTLGFSTYGMKTLSTENAIREISRIGFDSVELTVWPDWDASPGNMSPGRRKRIKTLLSEENLVLTSLMEHVYPSATEKEHATTMTRLGSVFDLANDLATDSQKPLVQTVLGGGNWETKKTMLRDRVGDWLKLASDKNVVLAVKPHRGGVMSQPSEAVWLIEQLGHSPNLKIVYDYSHYAFRGLELEVTLETALPYVAHVAVKDAVQRDGRVVFQLPGEAGTIDYVQLLRTLHSNKYRGDISCEVSGMVWNKPGYAPIAAAEICYKNVAESFKKADVPRLSR